MSEWESDSMGLLDFPLKIHFKEKLEVKRASYVFKNKTNFFVVPKNKAKMKRVSYKGLVKISKSKHGFFVIEPNSKFGKINDLKYTDITGVWKTVRYWTEFGMKVILYFIFSSS